MNELPLISCLCVTRGSRPALLAEAVACFLGQDYPRKELLIVTDADAGSRAALADLVGPGIRVLWVDEPGATLGRLRNLAMAAADGEVLCQWDDDDLSHPERLRRQHEAMAEADACFFTDQLQLFADAGHLYWNDWRRAARSERWASIPGTLMLRREVWAADASLRYPEAGPQARRGEDSFLLARLCDSHRVARLAGQGQLTIYRWHGANTFERDHHRALLRGMLTGGELRERELLLRAALAAYPPLGPLTVCSPDGPLFTVETEARLRARPAEARHAA